MKVLFVCRSNAGRSVMAEAFFNHVSKRSSASSAGSIVDKEGQSGMPPGGHTTEVMYAANMDVSTHKRRQLTRNIFDDADIVVALLTKEEQKTLPDYAITSDKTRYWEVKDMRGTDYANHVKGREEIRALVGKLVDETG